MFARPRGASLGGPLILTLAAGLLAGGPAHAIGQGEPAPAGSYGFVAKLELGETHRACSGTLIDPRWVVTASSCFAEAGQPVAAGPPTRVTTAVVGRTDLTGTGGHAVRVVELVPHPDRDVLLAKLATPVTDVTPAALATSAPTQGEVLRVAGFGRTATEWVPDRLHSAAFSVQAVAAGTVQVTGASPATASVCQGDAGGPAFREVGGQAQLVAVTSSAQQGGCLAESAVERGVVQTRVDNLADWVGQHVATVMSGAQLALRSFSSEETGITGVRAGNVLDGNPDTFWHTRYSGTVAQQPHDIQLDLRATRVVSDLFYLPRQNHQNGRIANYEVYASVDGTRWGAPVAAGTFGNGTAEQEISFIPRSARYVRLRALSEVGGGPWATVAELKVGVVSSAAPVTLRSVDSEETGYAGLRGAMAVDGDATTFWHTQYTGGTLAQLPHEIQLDLGASYPVADLYYLPRQDHQNGRIANYEVYVSADGTTWGTAVATGTFPNTTAWQLVKIPATTGRYVRLRALSEVGGGPWTTVAEIGVGIRHSGLVGPLKLHSFSSEETGVTGVRASNVLDGNPATFWHSRYSGTLAQPPHEIALDLGARYAVTDLHYLPRQEGVNGLIGNYEVYLSTNGTEWGRPVAAGTFPAGTASQAVTFPATPARYVKLKALSERSGGPWATVAELTVGLSGGSGGSVVSGANSLNPQPATVETFDYPGAAQVLAQRGIRLHRGDGHIVLVDCGSNPDTPPADMILVQTYDLELPGDPNFCFRARGSSGFLTMEIPLSYLIRGDNSHTIAAKVETLDDPVVVDVERVDPTEWQPVGVGQSRGEATILELRFPYAP